MSKVFYFLMVLTTLFAAFRISVQVSAPPAPPISRIIVGVGLLSPALLLWPWAKGRVGAWHIARVLNGVGLGTVLFVFPLQVDYGDAQSRPLNVGMLTLALILHGSIFLITTEVLRRAADKNQDDLAATCHEILKRVERLEAKLDARDQAVIVDVQAMAAAVERLERAGTGQRRWFGRHKERGHC